MPKLTMPYKEEGEAYEDDEEMYEHLQRMGDRSREERIRRLLRKQSVKNKKKIYLRKSRKKKRKLRTVT